MWLIPNWGECIKDLDIDFGSSAMFKVTEASRKYNDDLNPYIFRLSDTMDFKESNPFRDKLAVLDTYSVMYAACLLSGDSPTEIRKFQSHLEFTQVFSEYISYKLMIELAIKNNELKINDDKILASDLKEYLGKNGYFFRGFNDWIAIEPAKPLINNKPNEQLEASNNKLKEAQAKIADLENQLAQAKAGLADKPTDDLKDVPHQSYRTVDRVMYAMAKLAKRDNTEPYSQNNPSLNAAITTILQNDGLTLEYQAVGKWLSRINDIKPLK